MAAPAPVRTPLAEQLGVVYDGGSVTLRTLRALGWGPQLLNLGWFRWRGPLNVINLLPSRFRLAASQQRLVRESVRLLAPGSGDHIVDIACGRGFASYYVAQAHPGCEVTGVDLLSENIQIATTLYAATRGLRFQAGDALALPFGPAVFEKALCLEAAFHFPDKRRFLAEAARVLKPGGRLVLVDFMWRSADRSAVRANPLTEVVQKTWGWEDFAAEDEYLAYAREAGLTVAARHDWTGRVMRPLQKQFEALAWLGQRPWGRWLAMRSHELLRGLSRGDWKDFARAAKAHAFVQEHARYVALVLEKGRG